MPPSDPYGPKCAYCGSHVLHRANLEERRGKWCDCGRTREVNGERHVTPPTPLPLDDEQEETPGVNRWGIPLDHPEAHCDDCGGENPSWFADSNLWNLVMGGPNAKGDPGGIVCPTCFARRAIASDRAQLHDLFGTYLSAAAGSLNLSDPATAAMLRDLRRRLSPLGEQQEHVPRTGDA